MDAGNTVDGNVYGVIPFYQETRYGQNGSDTTAHGMYARNGMTSESRRSADIDSSIAHGQEWLLRANTMTYRTLGGSFDLYFLSGQKDDGSSSALTTISQFQVGCIGTPALQVR